MNAMAENGNREPSCFQTEAVSSGYDTASVFYSCMRGGANSR